MMQAAGKEVAPTPMLIGGQRRLAVGSEVIASVNPATGETIGWVPAATGEDVDLAVQAAAEAFPSWSRREPTERASFVLRLAQCVEDHAEELARIDVADNGSPVREMRNDAVTAAMQMRYFAGIVLQLRGETVAAAEGRLNYTLRQPFGVVGRLIPFNHPLLFAAVKVVAPILAGNTVVLKPSEHTSMSALRLADFFAEGLPAGVVNIITGYGHQAGDALVTHPGVRRLAFIGAAETGRRILARSAEKTLKSVTLELGGKNPLVIFPDSELTTAVDGAVRGMNFTWQGQSCGSMSRVLVHQDCYAEFVERLVSRVKSLRSGMPDNEETETGAIVNKGQYDKVLRYVQIGKGEGARLACGGSPPTAAELSEGLFIRPTVFADVDPGSRLAQEEIFGPVMAVMPFRDYDEAVRIANSVGYGLTAAVFTSDLHLAHRFACDAEAGYVWINDVSRHWLGTSFGGVKNSGVGREEDLAELESYTQSKNVHVNYGIEERAAVTGRQAATGGVRVS